MIKDFHAESGLVPDSGRIPRRRCTTCNYGFLCEPCHELQLAVNRGESKFPGREYCEKDHDYIKAPKGDREGTLTLASGESWTVNDVLKKVHKEFVAKAWEAFWGRRLDWKYWNLSFDSVYALEYVVGHF